MNVKIICKFSNIYLVLWIILSVLKCNIVKGLGLIKSSTSNDSEKDTIPGEKHNYFLISNKNLVNDMVLLCVLYILHSLTIPCVTSYKDVCN